MRLQSCVFKNVFSISSQECLICFPMFPQDQRNHFGQAQAGPLGRSCRYCERGLEVDQIESKVTCRRDCSGILAFLAPVFCEVAPKDYAPEGTDAVEKEHAHICPFHDSVPHKFSRMPASLDLPDVHSPSVSYPPHLFSPLRQSKLEEMFTFGGAPQMDLARAASEAAHFRAISTQIE